jgi:hypothetical protein
MFLLFHMAIPLGIVVLLKLYYQGTQKKPNNFLDILLNSQILILIIGSLLPDLIDKPMVLIFMENGRGWGHSLLIMGIGFIVLHFIFHNKNIEVAFIFGFLSHLLLDIPYVPWFYPFLQYNFDFGEDLLAGWFYKLFHDPVVMITESIGLAVLVSVSIKYKLYRFRNLKQFLIKI